jgi:GH15 family glucan-1,4-alpha-glucosidase
MTTLDLGLIGNCRTSALVDRNGAIVWWCYPYFDSDPICCSLLQPGRKSAPFGWIDVQFDGAKLIDQRYERNSAILVSRFEDDAGNGIELIDFAPRFYLHGRMFTPSMLVRRIRRISGRPRIAIRVRPAVNYGASAAEIRSGAHHISYVGSSQSMRVTTDASVTAITDEKPFFLHDTITLLMGPDQTVDGAPGEVGRSFYESTQHYWRHWVRNLAIPFEWQDVVIRSAITLKLNAFDDTGAIIAAVTTSIPEAPDSGRNWDYRYCWLRDAYFVVSALNSLGATSTMQRYLDYILNVIADTRDAPLQPVYSIRRESVLDEHVAPALAGYRGMGPVRVGNAAYTQIQNDAYGSVVLASVHAFLDKRLIRATGNRALFGHLEKLGHRAIEVFDKPDAGPWELRTKAAVHTFPSVMCWAACDRLAKIATAMDREDRAAFWRENADRMHHIIDTRAFNPEKGTFVSSFEGEHLDATLLLLAELNFVKPDDPRFIATVDAVGKALRRGDLLLRYDVEDDFGLMHTAFMICGFWYVDALNAIGRKDEARELFESILSLRNSFGLFSEDADFTTGELWGNFPQTYSMVGLINSAVRLSRSWEDAF